MEAPVAPVALVRRLASRLLAIPTAPCHEHAVRLEVERICAEEQLGFALDAFGNALVRYLPSGRGRTLVLAAHLDHPGFHIVGPAAERGWEARFEGGVPDVYFVPGVRVRLMPGDIPARIVRRLEAPKSFLIEAEGTVEEEPRFAVWDVEAFAIREGRVHARGCDDVMGCATALAVLIQLKRRKARANVMAVLSRAEEIGFYGALALAARRGLPKDAIVVSIETSKEMPPIAMGQGAILRVGDRSSVFHAAATRFLGEVAAGIQEGDRSFRYQRALMSGGTCEATAYLEHGYSATGLCVALGNYHNCGPENRIAEEYVSLEDVRGMVRLLTAAALAMPQYDALASRLRGRLDALQAEAEERLKSTL
jgi:endoglucanase